MVQRTIVVNQFTAAYLIEFTAEPRMVQPALRPSNLISDTCRV